MKVAIIVVAMIGALTTVLAFKFGRSDLATELLLMNKWCEKECTSAHSTFGAYPRVTYLNDAWDCECVIKLPEGRE